MMYIPCSSQVKLSPPDIVNLGIVCPRISAKNGKVCPESAKIVWRKRKRHPDMVPIPCPGQVQMFTPHTEYVSVSCRESAANYEKSVTIQKKMTREKEKTTNHEEN